MSQKSLLSLGIVLLVTAFFTVPYPHWGFDSDDAGFIWNGRITSLHDIAKIFSKGKNGTQLVFPSNYQQDTRNFLGQFHWYYRPLPLLCFGLQHLLFGTWAYGYYLIMILFHALSAMILFIIFYQLFSSYLWALWGALFFAFHISLGGWMGWIAAQQYTISMFCMLLATMLFYQYLQTKRLRHLFFTYLLYCFSVFLFEFTIIFPIFINSLWLIYAWLQERIKLPALSWFTYAQKTIGLWITSIFFLSIRSIMCASPQTSSSNLLEQIPKFINRFLERKADVISFLVDASNISFIPGGNQILKGSLIVLIASLFLYSFIKSSHKKIILFCCFNSLLFLWPAFLKQYTLRYLYFALPFIILMVLILILFTKYNRKTQTNLFIFLSMIVIGNMVFIIKQLKHREKLINTRTLALNDLIQQPAVHHHALCFVAIPRDLFWTGLAQNIWLLLNHDDYPIYFDRSTFTRQHGDILNNDISILRMLNRHRLISRNKKLYWVDFGGEETRLGIRTVLASNHDEEYDIVYTYNQELLDQKPLFITWDYEKNRFKLLE